MKKPFRHDELSDRECKRKGCRKRIKMNVITKQPDADLCFGHHQQFVRKNPRYNDGKKAFSNKFREKFVG